MVPLLVDGSMALEPSAALRSLGAVSVSFEATWPPLSHLRLTVKPSCVSVGDCSVPPLLPPSCCDLTYSRCIVPSCDATLEW